MPPLPTNDLKLYSDQFRKNICIKLLDAVVLAKVFEQKKHKKKETIFLDAFVAPFSILPPIQVPEASPLSRWIERTTQEL